MPGPEMDLKGELIESGNRLLRPPDEVDELLLLLDRVEHCLSFVEQQPAVGIQDALCPTFKALITNQLLKHPDADARVGVTACLTEISRITAPDVPYNDDLMKEVFRLTISSFEGLADNSSKSYGKRVSILEIVARVRSCAVLLDLECNDLVVEMFHVFYKCIRDFHTGLVFASMESIMTLVIEESEEISTDILFALLSVLRKDNKDALPIARKLGEKVVQNCANILKPCIVEAIKSLKVNLLDYDFVVTMACQITQDHIPLKDNALSVPLVSGSESAVVVEDVAQEAAAPSNGNTEVVEDATMKMLNTSNKADSIVVVRTAEIIQDQVQSRQDAPASDITMNPKPVSSSKSEPAPEKVAKKRGRKPKVAKEVPMQIDSGKLPLPGSNKESSVVNILTDSRKAPPEDFSLEPNIVAKKPVSSGKRSSPKHVVSNVVTLGSPSQSETLPGKSSSKRNRKSKKAMSTHEKIPSLRSIENDIPDGLDDTETRLVCLEKDAPDGVVDTASNLVSLVDIKSELDNEGESEGTLLKQSSLKLGVNDGIGTPRTKKRGRPRKDASMSVATGVKDRVSSEGSSKKISRHSFTPAEDGKDYGKELVGSRIKVWWPQDKEFYDGIVESFDPVKKKHKILYTDNEREVLNLDKQKWEFVESSVESEKNGAASHTNAGDSSDTQENKKLKIDSDSVGKMGNTSTPPKRRGRPPKSATALASHASADKGTLPDGEMITSKVDAGSPVKSMESPSNALPNLNDPFDDSEQEQEVPGNDGTRAKEDSTVGRGVIDSVTPKAATVGIDINETLILGSDENPNLDETATPKSGHSDVNVTEEVKLGLSGASKTEGLNKEISASDMAKKPRKRKARMSSNSTSPVVPGSPDTSVKRQRGRPSKLSLGTSDEKSKVLKKQLSDPRVEESRSGGHSDNLKVSNSEDLPVEGPNKPTMNAEFIISNHVVLDKNVTKSADSVMIGTKADDAVEQLRKSAVAELKSCSSTRLKLKLKTSDAESKRRKKGTRKTTGSTEPVKIDGSLKRPRGRPCKLKTEDPISDSKHEGSCQVKSNIAHTNGSGSSHVLKNDTPNVSNVPKSFAPANVLMKEKQAVPVEAVDLKLGLATESKGDDAREQVPEYEASKENMTASGSSKEQQSEATTEYEGEAQRR